MNTLLKGMKRENNYTFTENGALTHKTTESALLDLFAMGAAMRERSDDDVILTFKNAYEENPTYALKCLFYIRDIRGGQGERRFFRTVMHWMGDEHPSDVIRNMTLIPEYGRWDDLYCLEGTRCEQQMFAMMRKQFLLDIQCKTPSLLGKWMKSENTSSKESCRLGKKTREAINLDAKTYRHALTVLRSKIRIVETLMSQNRWDEIEFDKLPSKAGFIYRNAFAKNDVTKARYEAFMNSEKTKVNTGAMYPYSCVSAAIKLMGSSSYSKNNVSLKNTERLAINKYWENQTDYFNDAKLNALCMIDTSGSMSGTPIEVATSIGMYCAERAKGPFAGHYISFSSRPQLIEIKGVDFCDKVDRIVRTNLCENTNIEDAFKMLLNVAIKNNVTQNDLPEYIIVVSDMEFDAARGYYNSKWSTETLMEKISAKFEAHGYTMPKLIYWNVNALQANIPQIGDRTISYVSGFSPSIFKMVLSGKTGYELMMETLNQDRYEVIR